MASGGAAYKQLREQDDGISQGLQFWGQMQNKDNQDKRLAKERAGIRLDEKNKEFDKDFGDISELQLKISGFDTMDQVGADYTTTTLNNYFEQTKLAKEAIKNGDVAKADEAKMKMKRLKGSFKQVAEVTDKFKELNEQFVKLGSEGKISGVDKDNWEATMQSLNMKDFKMENDANGSPIFKGIKTNSDGTKEPYELRYSDIVNGNFRPYMRQDIGGLTSGVVKGLGSHESLMQKGLLTIKSQLWNPVVEEAAKGQIEAMVGSDEIVGDILNQLKQSTKREGFTQEERDEVAKYLLEGVKGGYKTKYEEEFNDKLAAHQRGLMTIAETKRSNLADEATARRNAATAAKQAEASMLNAVTNQSKVKHDISKDAAEPYNVVSEPFVKKDKNGNVLGEFSTITSRNEKHEQIPIYVGMGKDGKPEMALSISVDTKNKTLNYIDSKGKTVTLSAKDDPEKFNTVYSSALGKDEYNEDGTVTQANSTATFSTTGTSTATASGTKTGKKVKINW